jgi:hypothetical protein
VKSRLWSIGCLNQFLDPMAIRHRTYSIHSSHPTIHQTPPSSTPIFLPVLVGTVSRSCPDSAPEACALTLMKPISWLFSLKHWRQRLRPYLRMRPAGCVQTRLSRKSAGGIRFPLQPDQNSKAKALCVRVSAARQGRCDDTEGREKVSEGAYQDREPLPNWRGRLYQTLSCDMIVVLRIVFCSEGGSAASEEMLATIYAECVQGTRYGVP